MTTVAEKRRVAESLAAVQREWQAAWIAWGGEVMREWQRIDPDYKRKHDELFQPLYREWAASVLAGEKDASWREEPYWTNGGKARRIYGHGRGAVCVLGWSRTCGTGRVEWRNRPTSRRR